MLCCRHWICLLSYFRKRQVRQLFKKSRKSLEIPRRHHIKRWIIRCRNIVKWDRNSEIIFKISTAERLNSNAGAFEYNAWNPYEYSNPVIIIANIRGYYFSFCFKCRNIETLFKLNKHVFFDSVKFEKAVDTVARWLLVVCQQNTVDLRKFVKFLMQRIYYSSKFFAAEKSNVPKTKPTEGTDGIQITMASRQSDKVIGMEEVDDNKLVKGLFRNNV